MSFPFGHLAIVWCRVPQPRASCSDLMAKNLDQVKHGLPMHPQKKDVVTWFLWILKTTSILRGLNKAILVVASIRMTPSSSWDKASDWAKGTRNLSRHPVGSCRLEIQLMIHSSKMIGQPNIFFLQDGRHLELKINEDG